MPQQTFLLMCKMHSLILQPPTIQQTIGRHGNQTKADYFAKCYSIASELTEEKIAALNPNRYAIKLAALTTAFDRMTEPTLPSQLMLNPKCKIIPFDDQQSFFMISRLVKLPSIVAQIAPLFDGQSPAAEKVQETVKETLNVDLTNEYILHLYEQSILVAAN